MTPNSSLFAWGSHITTYLFNSAMTGPEVIKLFSYITQLSTKFQQLIKLKYWQMKTLLALSLSDVVFIMLINVKMPTIVVGVLTFMSRINFVLSWVEHGSSFITSRPDLHVNNVFPMRPTLSQRNLVFYLSCHELSLKAMTKRFRKRHGFYMKNCRRKNRLIKYNYNGYVIVSIPYCRYRYKNDSKYHAKNNPSYLLSNYHIIWFYWQQLFLSLFLAWIWKISRWII